MVNKKSVEQKDTAQMTYHVLPGPKMGLVTPEYLEQVAAVARKHKIPFLKLTGAQRIAIAGHGQESVEDIWNELGQAEGPTRPAGIHYIQACPGVTRCKYGIRDSIALGRKIEESLMSMPLPAKTKVGISGCSMNCCECYIRDIGIFAQRKGWALIFGGNGGGVPRIGDVIQKGLSDDGVIALASKCLDFYRQRARKMERTGRLMRRTSLEELRAFLSTTP